MGAAVGNVIFVEPEKPIRKTGIGRESGIAIPIDVQDDKHHHDKSPRRRWRQPEIYFLIDKQRILPNKTCSCLGSCLVDSDVTDTIRLVCFAPAAAMPR